ncbi:hypothetical protein SAPIO_CDS3531 [Scedosporium apiospermum]|uniref:Uncharacterized protein n=1 Tax=Pseudallescheria apiosperma TaxID=563466 RepID=A0A084GB01_PSEDA|nr:uncharacterized protein SAPIO_CDS3531 [Scedosporium apiospermum]KEZ44513.1 hypothetical protein SAPIO_CDS3531 [Scedosporium apiospermum]
MLRRCYNTCEPEKSPTPPPCDVDTPLPTYAVIRPPDPTKSPEYPPEPTEEPSSDCSSVTVCADYINECGLMYGGCFPDCTPWPTFTPPPCPTTTSTLKTHAVKPTKRPECSDGGEHIICVDKVNECMMKYGGCYDYCATPTPSFITPVCPTSTKKTTIVKPTRTRRTKTKPTPTSSQSYPPGMEEQCERNGSLILCADGIDECGNGWGTCFDVCATPTLSRPTTPCSITPEPTVASPEPISESCSDITLCIDYVNECGMWYGGCHDICSTPSYAKPPCPSTMTVTTFETATPTGVDPGYEYGDDY